MTDGHKRPLKLATVAWLNLLDVTQAYQAAILQGDADRANGLRVMAHDLLDANLDLNGEAAVAVRSIKGG